MTEENNDNSKGAAKWALGEHNPLAGSKWLGSGVGIIGAIAGIGIAIYGLLSGKLGELGDEDERSEYKRERLERDRLDFLQTLRTIERAEEGPRDPHPDARRVARAGGRHDPLLSGAAQIAGGRAAAAPCGGVVLEGKARAPWRQGEHR